MAGGLIEWERDGLPLVIDKSERITVSCMCQPRKKREKINHNLMKQKLLIVILLTGLLLQFTACIDDAADPDQDPREAFLGKWNVEENCVRFNYEVEISPSPEHETKVLMYNFALTGDDFPPAYGFVEGARINVPSQTIGDNWKVEGFGELETNRKISWEYEIIIAGDRSDCVADYGKP
jgi:hypothetical protein